MPTVSPVTFANTLESNVNAVNMGRVPVAEHGSLLPGYARKTGAGSGNIILGEANDKLYVQVNVHVVLYSLILL